MIAQLIFEHTAPTGLIVAALAVAVVISAIAFWRYLPLNFTTAGLALLRLLFLLGLAWCLLLPLRRETSATALKPRFVVLLDTSASMVFEPDVPLAVSTRWEVARSILRQPWPARLATQAGLEIIPFAGDLGGAIELAQVGTVTPDGPASRIHDALRKVVERFRGQTLGGILLLSDGLDTREAGAAWVEQDWPSPIYTVRLEPELSWEATPDVRVERVETPRRVLVGWDSKLTATIAGEGTGGRVLNVQLFEGETLLQEQPTQLPVEGGRRAVAFTIPHPEVGRFTYTVFVPPLAGEVVTNDNSYAVAVQVVDAKNRLLYVEGSPRFESKFLSRVLQASQTVAPLIFLQGADQKFFVLGQRGGMTTAMTREDLTEFKIVILGDLDAAGLGAERAETLLEFVEQGGSLVLLGGRNGWGRDGFAATPLRPLLPVQRGVFAPPREGRFSVQWTEEGKAHPAFAASAADWDAAPPVLTIFPGSELAAGAVALAQTDAGEPVVAAQRYGQGKVAAVLTDSLWRWRLEPAADDVYARFWTQLLEWMTPQESAIERYELDLFADTDQALLGEPIQLSARLGGREELAGTTVVVGCRIQTPDDRALTFPMLEQPVVTAGGRRFPGYGLEFVAPLPGMYTATATVEIGGETVESAPYSFVIKPFTPESNPRPLDAAALAALAAASGGRFLEPAAVDAVLSELRLEGREETRVGFASLWNIWPVLACLVGLLSVEWIVRKLKNLP